ncbi:hypothetical protein PWT90_00564 [Aphanocladium album]|nr:hypothetical protein PWT90_00564 [Aphanocladium album]
MGRHMERRTCKAGRQGRLTADVLVSRAHDLEVKYRVSCKRKHICYAIELFKGAIRRSTAPPAHWFASLASCLRDRYKTMRRGSDLSLAISIAQRGVEAAGDNQAHKLAILNTLAGALLSRYSLRKRFSDLRSAVRAAEEGAAISRLTCRHLEPVMLHSLAVARNHVYHYTGRPQALELAVEAAQNAVRCSKPDDPGRLPFLHHLSELLKSRFSRKGGDADIKLAFFMAKHCLGLCPKDHSMKPKILDSLCVYLMLSYEHTNSPAILENAIHFGRLAVKSAPANSLRLAICLGNLATGLEARHERKSSFHDLEAAVRLSEAALRAIPKNNDLFPDARYNLAMRMMSLYRWTGENKHLTLAVDYLQQNVHSTPANHRLYPPCLDALGTMLLLQHERTRTSALVEEAIKHARRAVELTPPNHPDQPMYLRNLAESYASLYDQTNEPKYLAHAMATIKTASQFAERSQRAYATIMTSLGGILERESAQTGDLITLKKAIECSLLAAYASPTGSIDKSLAFASAGNMLSAKYTHTGAMSDLDEAIARNREAIQAAPKSHIELQGQLNNLANKLHSQFLRTELDDTLDEAIQHATRAVELVGCDHFDRTIYTGTLASLLHSRFEHKRLREDLDAAIRTHRQVCSAASEDHNMRMACQYNLGLALEDLYELTLDEEFLEEATWLITESAQATAAGSSARAERLTTMIRVFETGRRGGQGIYQDEKLSELALEAWYCTAATPFVRVAAGYEGLKILARLHHQHTKGRPEYTETLNKALELGSAVLDLLPLVNTRYLTLKDRQFVMSAFAGVSSVVARLNLRAGEVSESVKTLERGRAVIINQIMSERQDVARLRQAYPELAVRYERLVAELNHPLPTGGKIDLEGRRQRTVKELSDCVEKIRDLPGYEAFQLPKPFSHLQNSIGDGYVVIVNATDFGSDAVVVSRTGINSVPLPNLSPQKIKTDFSQNDWLVNDFRKQYRRNDELTKALAWLWEACVRDILLEVPHEPGSELKDLPRVWWIGTGLATSLPFHAAGVPERYSVENAFSRVISSYTPSLSALAHTRQIAERLCLSRPEKGLLLLATMQKTPPSRTPRMESYPDLQTVKETDTILESVRSHMEVKVLEHPSVEQVSEALKMCSIAHFACHGKVDRRDPSKTALLLQRSCDACSGYQQDPLNFQQISALNLEHVQIAYLSACSTADIKALRLADEVIHLGSGFQIAGIPHVISSLWGANDDSCVQLARHFYDYLFDDSGTIVSENVAVSLHRAVQHIRLSNLDKPANWAQFIHYGI